MKNIGRDTTIYQLQVQTRPGMILKIVLLFLPSDGLVMIHQASNKELDMLIDDFC